MENKYYKPNISELSLNFEYEELISYVLADISNGEYRQISEHCEWLEKKVTLNDLSNILKPQTKDSQGGLFCKLTSNNIRVKYLDRSDLEELGFEYYSYFRDGGTSVFRTSNKEYEPHFYRTNSISDIDPDKINIIRHHENPSLKGQIFSGNIKNKSELKKLLKQLNIWN